MGTDSKIEYVNHSLNFWVGCQSVPDSPGCDNCYARKQMKMYGRNPYKVVRTSKAIWRQPLVKSRETGNYKWKSGERVFICTWSDFFHHEADSWRTEAWDVMRKRPDLKWVIVTKRMEMASSWIPLNWEWNNRTIMVTTENQAKADERIPQLLALGNQFDNLTLGLSIEPMLEKIWLGSCLGITEAVIPTPFYGAKQYDHFYKKEWSLPGLKETPAKIDWAAVGCESGPKRRPCKLEHIKSIVDQFKAANKPLFVKQLSINGKVSHKPEEWPAWARVRQYPK